MPLSHPLTEVMTKQNDKPPGKKVVKNSRNSFTTEIAKLPLRRQCFQMAASIDSPTKLKHHFQV